MIFSSEEKAYIWLDSFPLTDGEKRSLIEQAGGAVPLVKNFARIFPQTVKKEKIGVYNNMKNSLTDGGEYFKALLASYEREEVLPVTTASPAYPEALKKEKGAPLVLYAKGEIELLKTPLFAVVGSRITPEPVMETGKAIAKTLSEHFTLITGTAEGGDSAAIGGAIAGSGRVVCLFAGGFHAANKGNLSLLKKAKERGLLLSARPPKEPVRAFSYDERNKLLAQLCTGVLVISAGEKSGALITANYAQKFKKPVFALPHPPLSQAGVGCNALIKTGARLAETAEDILSVLCPERKNAGSLAPRGSVPALSETEQAALDVLKLETELPISRLAERLSVPSFKVNAIITSLEVKGLAIRTGGNRVAINPKKI
ncbi:MAG: DNA-protecting protein DprA [Clostridia bacterium]|nr:DNA-protecting protein DprA [Clostridia bacterium]